MEGFRLFVVMRECSVDPNLMTITSLISMCVSVGNLRLGKAIQGNAMRVEGGIDVAVGNALVQM